MRFIKIEPNFKAPIGCSKDMEQRLKFDYFNFITSFYNYSKQCDNCFNTNHETIRKMADSYVKSKYEHYLSKNLYE